MLSASEINDVLYEAIISNDLVWDVTDNNNDSSPMPSTSDGAGVDSANRNGVGSSSFDIVEFINAFDEDYEFPPENNEGNSDRNEANFVTVDGSALVNIRTVNYGDNDFPPGHLWLFPMPPQPPLPDVENATSIVLEDGSIRVFPHDEDLVLVPLKPRLHEVIDLDKEEEEEDNQRPPTTTTYRILFHRRHYN